MEDFLERLKATLLPLPVTGAKAVGRDLRDAAVLVPIVLRPEGLTMLLTRRADHLRSHAGQVSFPGGRVEPSDASPADAALRESFEEIGLRPEFVTLLGAIASHETGSGFFVHPVVGLVRPGFQLTIDEKEVAGVFEVPLALLMEPRNYERHRRNFGGTGREYFTISYNGEAIWGVTAAMIVMLYETVYGEKHNAAPNLALTGEPWMSASATRRVIAALESQGAPARFVGGCVRNALLGAPVKDIDIATPEEPETAMRLLAEAGIRVIPTGLDHGTVTAVVEGSSFEITTLRRDVSTDGRHATVAFTRDFAEDARRRDFTMNAIYAGSDGALYDYVGGVPDLYTRRVRFIGNPADRIAEDYLRILRFFRFHAWYGREVIDPAGLAACKAAKSGLAQLSAERVAQELMRILEARDPLLVLTAMKETEILQAILPEAEHLDHLERLLGFEAGADGVLRLAALIGQGPARAKALAIRLKLSGEVRDRLEQLAAGRLSAPMPAAAIHAGSYRLGTALFRDRALLSWAEGADDTAWPALIAEAARFMPPAFPLKGADVIAAGVAEGPEVGRILASLEEEWIAEDFKANRAELLKRLAKQV